MTLETEIGGKEMTFQEKFFGGIGLLCVAASIGYITYFKPMQYEKAYLNLPASVQPYDLNKDGVIDNKESQSLTNFMFKSNSISNTNLTFF